MTKDVPLAATTVKGRTRAPMTRELLTADGRTTAKGTPKNPLQLGLALPPRKPGDLAAYQRAEPHPPAAVGAGESPPRVPLLRPLGQPDPRTRLTAAGRLPPSAGTARGGGEATPPSPRNRHRGRS
jgi:hypothetical protein